MQLTPDSRAREAKATPADESPTPELQAMLDAPTGSDEALTRDLGLLMRELMSRSNPAVFHALDDYDISFSQAKIVMTTFMGDEAPRSIKDIADGLGLSFPATSRAVDGLLKKGLITRTEAEHDRRIKQIALTPAGREITRQLFELRIAGIREFVASLDPADRKRLAATLEPIFERTPHA
jgi:DNA-binding MarR family transcriptional regulator